MENTDCAIEKIAATNQNIHYFDKQRLGLHNISETREEFIIRAYLQLSGDFAIYDPIAQL